MKPALRITTLWATALLVPAALPAADETIFGSLTVEQDLLVHQAVGVGQATLGSIEYPAYALQANSTLGTTILDQTAYGTITSWNWLTDNGTGAKPLLKLENTGKLALYNPANPVTPVIVLDAGTSTPIITIAGKRVVTEDNIGAILASNSGGNGRLAIGGSGTGYGATALGHYSIAEGDYSTALGMGARTGGWGSIALGNGTWAEGNWTITLGNSASATGDGAITMGFESYAGGSNSISLGNESYTDDYSIALGHAAGAQGESSTALGHNAKTTRPYQVALGSYNQPIDSAHFMLGNGTGWNAKSNLFVIMKDGRGIFRSTSYVEPTAQNPNPVQPVALTVEGSTEIKGDAKIKGTLRVRPAGDLPMGIFTAGGQP